MNLNRKLTLVVAGVAFGILAVLIATSLYAFRSYSIDAARAQLRTAAEMVRVHLTEAMSHGAIDARERYLDRLGEVQDLRAARVVRAEAVNAQFGGGLGRERPADDIERAVLADGVARYVLRDEFGDAVFRGTIPFVATARGAPDCLQCHAVAENTVLGAVSVELSLAGAQRSGIVAVSAIIAAVALFAVLAIWTARRLIQPVGATAQAVEQAVQRALAGDFKDRIAHHSDDELGQIASHTNRLLSFLDDGLARISQRVTQILGRAAPHGGNQLETTIAMVNGLADASAFKQEIEREPSRLDVYRRFGALLAERFGIHEFTIHETGGARQLVPVVVGGVIGGGGCGRCDPDILMRGERCEVSRTGRAVDGLAGGGCRGFRATREGGEARRHYCMPVPQSGERGGVLQLVVPQWRAAEIAACVPDIEVYVREMAPVLEARRLNESLRDSALRDAMTGLNNRRFLEEYVETLLAGVRRRRVPLALLLLDLDHFKAVNDTYGHDAGDAVLKALALRLRQSVRESDLVIRLGGEEFLIVLQDAGEEAALKVAEHVRAAVERMAIDIGDTVLHKTVSIGAAMYPADSEVFWQAVKFADVALYRAKAGGRNRVVRFAASMSGREALA